MKAQVGMKVEAYASSCIGLIIESTTWNGEIVKVNSKSIRVSLTDSTSKKDDKIIGRRDKQNEVSYRFVKTLSNGRDFYRSDSDIYGSITI